jgi:hypothetical protein
LGALDKACVVCSALGEEGVVIHLGSAAVFVGIPDESFDGDIFHFEVLGIETS